MSVEKYRQYIQDLLTERAQQSSNQYKDAEEYEIETLFDTDRDHYQLLNFGWLKNRRSFSCTLHLDIRNGKFGSNMTEPKKGLQICW